ncbi:MAG: hypothetical protein MRZ48_08900 [Anaerostipes hadrus]|nr:hypothetical protein [Anaerostipes hadrus]
MDDVDLEVHKQVISIFSCAGLATALISWLTTASGLNQYVFPHLWQALVISGSIQGALFTCNIKGPEIIRSLKRGGKIIFVAFYAIVLLSSSIFSYVFMESVAYPESVFKDDADRILITQCLEINYIMSTALNYVINEKLDLIDGYITELSVNSGSESTETGINLEELITQLSDDTEFMPIISTLRIIGTGRYSVNDMKNAKDYLSGLKETLNIQLENNKNVMSENSLMMVADSERLKTYQDTSNPNYIIINDRVKQMNDSNNNLKTENDKLNKQINVVDALLLELNNIDGSLQSSLQKNVRSIRICMNKGHIDTSELLSQAATVYESLIENNVKDDDKRLSEYGTFKRNIESYGDLSKVKEMIDKEIIDLNARFTSLDSGFFTQADDEVQNEISQEALEQQEIHNEEVWRNYWHERIGNILMNIKDISEQYLYKAQEENENIYTKVEIIQNMSKKERLYVSDLNNFEKAWCIIGKEHQYRKMAIFSAIFALFIDLFSAMMGNLIFQYKKSVGLK